MMMKKDVNNTNKKADISAAFLITVILAVLGFGIVLFVYSQFGWTTSANEQTCHQSVVYRATLPSALGAKSFVPLKCQTEKICITSRLIGAKCKDLENTQGVVKTKVINKAQVEQVIAKRIIDCWEMMGQGRLSLFTQWTAQTYGFSDIISSCTICSRIAFDKESLASAGINPSDIDVMGYMTKHLMPGKTITYYDYLGGNNGKISIKSEDIDKVIQELSKSLNQNSETQGSEVVVNDQNPNSDELAIMFMQISAPKIGDVWKNSALALFGGGAFLYSAGGKALVSKLCTGPQVKICAILGLAALIVGGTYQAYTVFNNNAIAAGYCGDINVGDKAEIGCSVVRTVNYGAEDLSKYCNKIESIA